jgi:D-alanine-D-alanine ligase
VRVCLLTDQNLDRPHPPGDFPCDPRPYLEGAEWTLGVLEAGTSVRQVMDLARQDFDLFFNLCDAAWGESRPGIEVVDALERLGLPFTGATSRFFEPSREAMKRVCRAWGIDTPAYAIVRTNGEPERAIERALDTLRFPLIVKHPSSYSSVGLTPASKVETAAQLREQVRLMSEPYLGALVEEFIEGTEATVLVAESPTSPTCPTTYVPIRYRFPDGESFKHYDLKWVDYHGLGAEPIDDPELEARLRRISADFFVGIEGAGYARCDMRIDADGRPFILEINPNPGVYYPLDDPGSADLILQHDPAGHSGFTRQVVDAALARHRRRKRGWEVLPHPRGGYGLHAARAFAPGELVIPFEETPHELVSRSRVETCWGEPQRSWFDRYAWPLTDEVWVMWSRDPMQWKPVNHSCEPTAWVDGLDLVARLALEPGDEITVDYATIYNERLPAFECACGADVCRGRVQGDDHMRPFVARYGDHVTDYVRRKRSGGC